ncbi:SCP super family [Kluyveromyces marxianus]|uniref:SCP super family n=1 Tax=Kluyveromyces marxianus (strain DMKU3-1042 / BCC 29191 / NBRC 104275) TaxID=1003335 RepID=W0T6G4_KLUMD|nr:SCP super family [Kluyveromyces marxianus DMKU3-1042]BAO37689.1 SCP super family [Kluyveromyces marxianus DMKU3-1042]BAP69260.1 SCP super family [Kluyveromyces marxianus]
MKFNSVILTSFLTASALARSVVTLDETFDAVSVRVTKPPASSSTSTADDTTSTEASAVTSAPSSDTSSVVNTESALYSNSSSAAITSSSSSLSSIVTTTSGSKLQTILTQSVVAKSSSSSSTTAQTSKSSTTTSSTTTSKSSTTTSATTTSKSSTTTSATTTSKSSTTTSATTTSKSSTTTSATKTSIAQSETTAEAISASDRAAVLDTHNSLRARHQDTGSLVWNDDLAAYAYNYAQSLKGGDSDPCNYVLKHSGGQYGENLAAGTNSSPADLVNLWYDEIKYYDYNNVTGIEHDGHEVGHFTQLVWASSTDLGCSVERCTNGAVYLICEYSPAGNIYVVGEGVTDHYMLYEQNVKPLKSTQ